MLKFKSIDFWGLLGFSESQGDWLCLRFTQTTQFNVFVNPVPSVALKQPVGARYIVPTIHRAHDTSYP
jgi:hypothetical protein